MNVFINAAIAAFAQAGRYIGGWRRTRAGKPEWSTPINTAAPLTQTAAVYWRQRRAQIVALRVRRWQRANPPNTKRPPRHIREAMRARR